MSGGAWLLALPGAISSIGTIAQGKDQARGYRMQAEVARQQGRADEEAQRREGRQFIGKQAAAMSEAGGIDEKVLEQSAAKAELDALNIRYGAQLESTGLLSAAKSVKKQSRFLAGTQLLSGITNAYAYSRAIK